MNIEFITFLLAMLGYFGLTGNGILAAQGKYYRILMLFVATLVGSHVFLVWNFRYEWQLSQATRNGYGGFFLFHTALLFIMGAAFLRERAAKFLIVASFLIVSSGALGAIFIYDEVAIYRYPVIGLFLLGMGFLGRGFQQKHWPTLQKFITRK